MGLRLSWVKFMLPAKAEARRDVERIDGERDDQPRQRRAAAALPQPRGVEPRKEEHEQRDAHGELDRGDRVASTYGSRARIFVGHHGRRSRYCTTICGKITQSMRILMIAPEPFFEPRGTPFSEYHRIKALTTLGHEIDLVTYPFGQPVELPG